MSRTATAAWLLVVLLAGCGDDDAGDDDGPSDAGVELDAAATCESFATEHERLLNAPTDADVVRKTPTHPAVGDAGLP